VKSLRAGHASPAGAFVQEHDGELMIHGLYIPEHGYGRPGHHILDQPKRTRKLLLHRSEIDKITARLSDTGVTLVPLSLYFQDGWAKVEIALARGRRSFDKRPAMAQRVPTGRLPASSATGSAAGADPPADRADRRRKAAAMAAAGGFRHARGLGC
jgi:SsrA-binding protein